MPGKTVFIGKRAIEELSPINNSVVISISDSGQDEADLIPGWEKVHRFHFVDGGYDESSLRFVGRNYKYIYSSYFDRNLAIELREIIQRHVNDGVQTIVINCHAGRSRSAAVAKYIFDTHKFVPFSDISSYNSLANADQVKGPDFSRMNVMVYTLLQNPFHFDEVINQIEHVVEPPQDNETSFRNRFNKWYQQWFR